MKKSTSIRLGVGAASMALLLTACGGSGGASGGTKGGTLTILTEAEQILQCRLQSRTARLTQVDVV